MNTLFFRLRAYLRHWVTCLDRHSLQAPFIYDLYQSTIVSSKSPPLRHEIESLRNHLLKNTNSFQVTDYGTGRNSKKNAQLTTVSHITRNSSCSPKEGKFLWNLCEYFQARHVLELGTSMGIGSSYMASSSFLPKIYTFEGCPRTAEAAKENFKKLNLSNLQVFEGNIDQTLPSFLSQSPKLDLVYLDANHTYEATLRYFLWLLPHLHKHSVVVFDDIHWSQGMEKAWKKILRDSPHAISIDLFDLGVLFFDPAKKKQHYVLRF
ncbi:MAG: class I SAM-dependent methyltransferase [Cytophagales bacterium]|nr:class I SAM-dependent methyltransferase [Cytophagales bacterium]